MNKCVSGTEHISEDLAKFIGKTLGIVAEENEERALKLANDLSKIVDKETLGLISVSQFVSQLGQLPCKEVQTGNILREDEDDE